MAYARHKDDDDDGLDAGGIQLVPQTGDGLASAAAAPAVAPTDLPTHDGDFGHPPESEEDSDAERQRYPQGRQYAAPEHVAKVCGMEWTVFASIVCVAVTLVVCIIGVVVWAEEEPATSVDLLEGVSMEEVEHCLADHTFEVMDQEGRGNQRLGTSTPEYVLIKNANIYTGSATAGEESMTGDILIKNARIHEVGQGLTAPAGALEVDVDGRVVTPGIVDMHSNAGLYGWPHVWAREDGNEATDPTFPQVRAIDAYHPGDAAVPHILGGGVTTSHIQPGSADVMGGEAMTVKMRGTTVRDAYYPGSPRALKHAVGENPKRVYGRRKGVTPMTRMGSAWVMRQQYAAARDLIHLQQDWCRDPQHRHEDVGDHDHTAEYFDLNSHHTPFPRDLKLNGLVALLRGQALLHVHGYEVQDIEMMLRLSREFGFNVTAFHHASEMYRIPDIALESGAVIATFADQWGYKTEAYDTSTRNAATLDAAGVPVAIKSDHPVVFARDLMFEAAKAHYYGLSKWKAIAAVTSVPAAGIGLEQHIGQVRQGFDADLVVWDRDPLVLGAKPHQVWVNGEKLVDNNIPKVDHPTTPRPTPPTLTMSGGPTCVDAGSPVIAITGVTVYPQNPALAAEINDATILVVNGTVQCVGSCTVPADASVYNLQGGFVTPGFVESMSHIGQTEIDAEDSTRDGHPAGTGSDAANTGIMAYDGIRLNTRHVEAAWRAGVTTSVSHPQGRQLFGGLSVAFYTHGVTVSDALIHPHAALHLNVGAHAKKGGITNSISGQFHTLRDAFHAVNASEQYSLPPASIIHMAKNKFIPVVVHVHQADVIDAAIRFHERADCNMVICGGAEAHLLADTLAAKNIPVILKSRVPPYDFQTLRARADAIVVLKNAGVKVGLAVGDEDNARNLRWEAGFAMDAGLTFDEALATVTTNVAQIYGLPDHVGRIVVGQPANFVVFDGAPLTLQGKPVLVVLGDYVECNTQQR